MAVESREKRKAKVLDVLNKARAMELTAITQYMNQHYNLDNMDYGEMAANMKLIAIDEMRHAEMFAERIKELDCLYAITRLSQRQDLALDDILAGACAVAKASNGSRATASADTVSSTI